MLNGVEKLCGDVWLLRQYQTDKILLVQQIAGIRLQGYSGLELEVLDHAERLIQI